jgi:hypothetical protein
MFVPVDIGESARSLGDATLQECGGYLAFAVSRSWVGEIAPASRGNAQKGHLKP